MFIQFANAIAYSFFFFFFFFFFFSGDLDIRIFPGFYKYILKLPTDAYLLICLRWVAAVFVACYVVPPFIQWTISVCSIILIRRAAQSIAAFLLSFGFLCSKLC